MSNKDANVSRLVPLIPLKEAGYPKGRAKSTCIKMALKKIYRSATAGQHLDT